MDVASLKVWFLVELRLINRVWDSKVMGIIDRTERRC
jgi:hypothetical protein